MRGLFLHVVAVAAVPLTPARAADVATINCVVEQISADGRAALVSHAEELTVEKLTHSGLKPQRPPEIARAIGTASLRCAKLHGWSREAALEAGVVAMADVSEAAAGRVLRERGVDVDGVKLLYLGLPQQQREAEDEKEFRSSEFDAMFIGALTRGFFTERQSGAVGGYIGFLYLSDSRRARFSHL